MTLAISRWWCRLKINFQARKIISAACQGGKCAKRFHLGCVDRGSLISSRTTQLPHHYSPLTRLISLQSFLNLALFMLRQRVGWSSSSTSSKPLSLVLPGYCFTEREMAREMSSLRKHVFSLYTVRAVPSIHNEEQSCQFD